MLSEHYHPRLEIAAVRERYRDPVAYSGTDDWHRYTAAQIRREITRSFSEVLAQPGRVILNAGAGNNDLGVCPATTINLDISESGVSQLPNPLIGSVEKIPLPSFTVDTIVCVGSVINYCDAAKAISEFGRVLRPNGQLILEFESSQSAEFIGKEIFGRPVAVAETFYQNALEVVRVYDPKYVRNLLNATNFKISKSIPIHIMSPWALRARRGVKTAAVIAKMDWVLRAVPFVGRWAGNQILFCTKVPAPRA